MSRIAAGLSPAGFWKRYVAYFIDVLLLYVVIEILAAAFLGGDSSSQLQQIMALTKSLDNPPAITQQLQPMLERTQTLLWQSMLFSTLAYVLVGGLYFVLMEASTWQATLGKRLVGIKVTDVQGQRIGVGRAAGRFFAASLSWLTLNVGHALAAWTPERRALHDYVAGTRVENADPAHPAMPLWGWAIIALHALIFVGSIVALVALVWLVFQAMAQTM
jgi:uncharacterized RDD family membrane protein YckC